MLGRYVIAKGLGESEATSVLTPEEEALYKKKKKQTIMIAILAVPFLAIVMNAFEAATKKILYKE